MSGPYQGRDLSNCGVGRLRVAINCGVLSVKLPRKTLDDRIRGNVSHGKKPGRTTILTPEEEESLTQYLLYMAERGFPLTRMMVKAFAWAIAKCSGNDARFSPEQGPSEHWWQLFRKRHPNIVLRKSDSLERTRAEAFNEVIVTEYFEILRNTLTRRSVEHWTRTLTALG